ncbi:MAG TPA: hypothetical protein VII75_09875 [Thermoanaerobaculia bacterium]|nr:hypothetical protein [Thermoanaerobaculia bacterium]
MRKLCLLLFLAFSASAQVSQFTGTWVSTDPETHGIVKLTITGETSTPSMQMWAYCRPAPCDWGRTTAVAYAPDPGSDPVRTAIALTASFSTSYSYSTVVVTPNAAGGTLTVAVYTQFREKNGASRFAFTGTEEFRRV